MKKRFFTTLLACVMVLSCTIASANLTSQIGFADNEGYPISYLPDIGAVEVTAPSEAQAVVIAEYSKSSNELLRISTGNSATPASMAEINDFDSSTYVKAFALADWNSVKPVTKAATIAVNPGKTLLVSYANGVNRSYAYNGGKEPNSDITYGSAAYSAKRSTKWEKGQSLENILPEGKTIADYNTVKIRYYAGNTDTDRFWFCFMSNEQYGTYNSLTNRYLYTPVIPQKTGWNVAEFNVYDMSKNNTSNNSETEEDDTVALPLSEVTHFAFMADQKQKLFSAPLPETFNDSLYIDSAWLETNEINLGENIDFGSSDSYRIIANTSNLNINKTIADSGKVSSAEVVLTGNGKSHPTSGAGMISLAAYGVPTDWTGYEAIKIRYYKSAPEMRFNLAMANSTTRGSSSSTGEDNFYMLPYSNSVASSIWANESGWHTMIVGLSDLIKWGKNEDFGLDNINYLQIMTDEAGKIYPSGSAYTYLDSDVLCIDSIELIEEINLEDNTVINFNSSNDWLAMQNTNIYTVDTNVTDTANGSVRSAKITKSTSNTTGYIDLADIGFTTDWSGYKTINIRYKTSDTGYVPPVYLSTTNTNWVTTGGLDGTHQAYRLKTGIYASKKAADIEWTTVSYRLPVNDVTTYSDFTTYGAAGRISMSNIPYLLIPTHLLGQYWNGDANVAMAALDVNTTAVYIDKIWLSEDLNELTRLDFSNDAAWNYIGAMTQFTKAKDFGYDGKTYSAKLSKTTSNTTGFIDLARIGFVTDWSEYKTINIRYYTDNTDYVPPVYLASAQNWVTSNGLDGEHGTYKLKSGLYTGKKPSEAGWYTVSYKLPVNNVTTDSDFSYYGASGKLVIENIPYLLIPNYQLQQYWGGDANVTTQSINPSESNVYLDSIWLE